MNKENWHAVDLSLRAALVVAARSYHLTGYRAIEPITNSFNSAGRGVVGGQVSEKLPAVGAGHCQRGVPGMV